MNKLTVGELREFLAKLPADAEIIIQGRVSWSEAGRVDYDSDEKLVAIGRPRTD